MGSMERRLTGRDDSILNLPGVKEFERTSVRGEGLLAGGDAAAFWVRVYDTTGKKALATFYVLRETEQGAKLRADLFKAFDDEDADPAPRVKSLGLAVPRRGRDPHPFDLYHEVDFVFSKRRTQEEEDEWYEKYFALIDSLTDEQVRAVQAFPLSNEAAWVKPKCLSSFTDEEVGRLRYWLHEGAFLNRDRVEVRRSEPGRQQDKGVRAVGKIKAVPAPGGRTSWRFPWGVITSEQLAEVLLMVRMSGEQKVTTDEVKTIAYIIDEQDRKHSDLQ